MASLQVTVRNVGAVLLAHSCGQPSTKTHQQAPAVLVEPVVKPTTLLCPAVLQNLSAAVSSLRSRQPEYPHTLQVFSSKVGAGIMGGT